MSDISQFNIGVNTYDIKDTIARSGLATKQNIIQKTTLPTAGSAEEGNIYQYVGATRPSGYENGHWYQCQETTVSGTYTWEDLYVDYAAPNDDHAITSNGVYRTLSGKQDLMVITTDFDLDYKTSDGQVIIWGGTETYYKKGRLYLVSINSQTGTKTLTELSTLTTAEKTKFDSLSPILQTAALTLTTAGWNSTTKQQTITLYSTYSFKDANRNVIDITLGEEQDWADSGVMPVSTTTTTVSGVTYLESITFECEDVPSSALTFRVTSMEVS